MEFLNIFIDNVRQFYECVENEANRFEDLLKKATEPCSVITNQCLILNSVLPRESLDGTGLENLPKFRTLLISSVLNTLKKQLDILLEIRNDIFFLVDGLYKKHASVEESFKKLQNSNFNYLQILNPVSPRLEHVVDWSLDVWRYYHSLYLQISVSIENINFEISDSVTLLVGSFKENEKLKEKVNKIRRLELHIFPFIE